MEPSMQQVSYFVVTKGFRPGVYSSFEEDTVAGQLEAMGISNPSPPTTPRTFPAGEGRLAPLVGGITWLPADVSASYPFALNNKMEKWLERVCSKSSIPPACFFREEVFVAEGGPLYRFNICLPGNPVERGLRAKGRFSPIEDDAKDDAAFCMLRLLLQKTEREIWDFNFLRAKHLEAENYDLCQRIQALEARIEQLESGSEDSLHFAASP
ncbi:hypothetical protein PIB30_097401 [Stylosanthes scabra]|uniref:Uncharacterized protein n=1 Tax=Stylosanthes scabra TaxID=79078 RepID=A0ABU6ZV10_9FABA|nr:hypothetical protein [Stylosanthes scabra]